MSANGKEKTLRVMDIGAGLLSMLPRIMSLRGDFNKIEYFAFESELCLKDECALALENMGFNQINHEDSDSVQQQEKFTFFRTKKNINGKK